MTAELAFSFLVAMVSAGVIGWELSAWRKERQARRRDARAAAAHRAEVHVGTWRCPFCRTTVPLMATRREHLLVDPLDVHAHLLTHTEAGK